MLSLKNKKMAPEGDSVDAEASSYLPPGPSIA